MIPSAAPTHRPDAGVTLIETLVVLAILATAVGAAMLAIPQAGTTATATREAQLLQARLTRAVDASLGRLQPVRLRWDPAGYVFEAWDGTAWGGHEVPVLALRHDLTGGVALDGEGVLQITPDLLPPEGGAVVFTLSGGAPARLRFDGVSAVLETGT